MSVLCAVVSRPFFVLPMWLCPFVPAALAAFLRRDALQRDAVFLGHEVGVFVVSLFSTDVAVSVVFTASVESATPKGKTARGRLFGYFLTFLCVCGIGSRDRLSYSSRCCVSVCLLIWIHGSTVVTRSYVSPGALRTFPDIFHVKVDLGFLRSILGLVVPLNDGITRATM